MANKYISWFATDAGRGTVGLLGVVGFTTSLLADWLPNTYMMPQVKGVVQRYKEGLPVPVPTEFLEKLAVVSTDMKLEPELFEKLTPFTVYGFDMFSAGKSSFKTGAMIGIPSNLYYKTPKDIDKKNIMVGNKSVNWTSSEGLLLESALLMSESAKKFALAREIASTSSYHVPFQTTLNGVAVFLYMYLSSTFNKKAKLMSRPVKIRVMLYTLLGSMIFTVWLLVRDVANVYHEKSCDKVAGSINEEYARGAVEYYTKILQRNVALRSLLGPDGAKIFTPIGNDSLVFRTKHEPYTARRDASTVQLEKFTPRVADGSQ